VICSMASMGFAMPAGESASDIDSWWGIGISVWTLYVMLIGELRGR
jgi:hypothetical protein